MMQHEPLTNIRTRQDLWAIIQDSGPLLLAKFSPTFEPTFEPTSYRIKAPLKEFYNEC